MNAQTKTKLFHENIKLAYSSAYRYYSTRGEIFEDIKQACLLGLWKSLDTFNPTKGELRHHAINFMMDECNEVMRHRLAVSIPKYQYKNKIRLHDNVVDIDNIEELEAPKNDDSIFLEQCLLLIEDRISKRPSRKGSRVPAMLKKYFLELKTPTQISKELGCARQNVTDAAKKFREEIRDLCY